MGRVYLALMRSEGETRFCVVKQVGSAWTRYSPDELAAVQQRFRRDAEVTMALSHHAIARTLGVGSDPEPYLVQEFVHGTNLRDLVPGKESAGTAVPIALASHIALEVALALDYLHSGNAGGLVHRDLTPEKVLLASTGEVKLLDVGFTKATVQEEGLIQRCYVGNVDWMAPEILRGARPDHRADLYALGLLYWFLLTGHDPGTTLSNRINTTERFPPPSAFDRRVPAALDRLAMRAIDPDPRHRFQSARAFQQALALFVPRDFQGPKQVANLVHGNTSRAVDRLLPRLLAEGVPLLERTSEQPPAQRKPTAAPAPHPHWCPLAAVSIGGTITLALLFRLTATGEGPKRQFFPAALQAAPVSSALPAEPTPVQPSPPIQPTPVQPSPPIQPTPVTAATVPSPPRQNPPAPSRDPRAPSPRKHASPGARSSVLKAPPQPNAAELLDLAKDSFDRSDIAGALRLARLAASRGAGATAYVLIGSCLSLNSDYAGARAAFEHAVRLSPERSDARRLLAQLRRAKGDDTP